MPGILKRFSYTVTWNLALITLGTALIAFALKAVAIPQGFITGGISGTGLLIYYLLGGLSPGAWYLVLNVPLFLMGWLLVSRRFFFYSLYGTVSLAAFIQLLPWVLPIADKMLAAVVCGAIFGAGAGIALRTYGSTGGLDIVSVYLNQRFNLRMGKFSFAFNCSLFFASLFFLDLNLVLYSGAMVFVSAVVMEYFLAMFNQRKMVLVISELPDQVADTIMSRLSRGCTFLYGRGAYTGKKKKLILTVINNIQLKRLEQLVYEVDPNAFTIVENSLNVLGQGFSARKIY